MFIVTINFNILFITSNGIIRHVTKNLALIFVPFIFYLEATWEIATWGVFWAHRCQSWSFARKPNRKPVLTWSISPLSPYIRCVPRETSFLFRRRCVTWILPELWVSALRLCTGVFLCLFLGGLGINTSAFSSSWCLPGSYLSMSMDG